MFSRAQRRLRALLSSYPRTLTPADVAAACGVTVGAVCHWCCARRRPSLASMRVLEERYGIPMRDWVSDEESAQLPAAG